MYQVRSELIARGDLGQMLLSSLQVNEQVLAEIPVESVEVYRAGFLAALKSVATAYGLNLPQLREAEAAIAQRRRPVSQYDMRL